jgi:hypothetical protein
MPLQDQDVQYITQRGYDQLTNNEQTYHIFCTDTLLRPSPFFLQSRDADQLLEHKLNQAYNTTFNDTKHEDYHTLVTGSQENGDAFSAVIMTAFRNTPHAPTTTLAKCDSGRNIHSAAIG